MRERQPERRLQSTRAHRRTVHVPPAGASGHRHADSTAARGTALLLGGRGLGTQRQRQHMQEEMRDGSMESERERHHAQARSRTLPHVQRAFWTSVESAINGRRTGRSPAAPRAPWSTLRLRPPAQRVQRTHRALSTSAVTSLASCSSRSRARPICPSACAPVLPPQSPSDPPSFRRPQCCRLFALPSRPGRRHGCGCWRVGLGRCAAAVWQPQTQQRLRPSGQPALESSAPMQVRACALPACVSACLG